MKSNLNNLRLRSHLQKRRLGFDIFQNRLSGWSHEEPFWTLRQRCRKRGKTGRLLYITELGSTILRILLADVVLKDDVWILFRKMSPLQFGACWMAAASRSSELIFVRAHLFGNYLARNCRNRVLRLWHIALVNYSVGRRVPFWWWLLLRFLIILSNQLRGFSAHKLLCAIPLFLLNLWGNTVQLRSSSSSFFLLIFSCRRRIH